MILEGFCTLGPCIWVTALLRMEQRLLLFHKSHLIPGPSINLLTSACGQGTLYNKKLDWMLYMQMNFHFSQNQWDKLLVTPVPLKSLGIKFNLGSNQIRVCLQFGPLWGWTGSLLLMTPWHVGHCKPDHPWSMHTLIFSAEGQNSHF